MAQSDVFRLIGKNKTNEPIATTTWRCNCQMVNFNHLQYCSKCGSDRPKPATGKTK